MEGFIHSLASCDRPKSNPLHNSPHTLFLNAVSEGNLLECQNLIDHFHADVNQIITNHSTYLHIASQKKNLEMMTFLIDTGINIDVKEDDEAGGDTPLLTCIKEGFTEVCSHLPF